MTRLFLALLLAGTVSGCLSLTRDTRSNALLEAGFDTMPEKYCTTDNSAAAKADWNNATVVEETVSNSRYESGLMTLWHEKPYIIRVTNNDDGDRSFRAPQFFRDVAILKGVYNSKSVDAPCINAVNLAPGAVAELHVVPLKKGDYDYHETGLWVPFAGEIFSTSDVGYISVH